AGRRRLGGRASRGTPHRRPREPRVLGSEPAGDDDRLLRDLRGRARRARPRAARL
ncbi:MAG: hypothetical protein AVDCRST_MAG85-4061, partial [uncultured Solirubrobacteraceae bacterium]